MLQTKTSSAEGILLASVGGKSSGTGKDRTDGGGFAEQFDSELSKSKPKPAQQARREGESAHRNETSKSASSEGARASEKESTPEKGASEDSPLSQEEKGRLLEGDAEQSSDPVAGEDGNVLPLFQPLLAAEESPQSVAINPIAQMRDAASKELNGDAKQDVLAARLAQADLARGRGEIAEKRPSLVLDSNSADQLEESGLELAQVRRDTGMKQQLERLVSERGLLLQAGSRRGDASGDPSGGKGGIELPPGMALSAGSPLSGRGGLVTPLPQQLDISQGMGQKGWNGALGRQVVWVASSQVKEAQIQLHPRHLGPIEVKVSVNQEQQATVQFTVQHAATREAVENALPRLREMFAEQGLDLAQSDVSQHHSSGQQGEGEQSQHGGALVAESDESQSQPLSRHHSSLELGVDYYA